MGKYTTLSYIMYAVFLIFLAGQVLFILCFFCLEDERSRNLFFFELPG